MALDLEPLDRQERLDNLSSPNAEPLVRLERVERLLERAGSGVAGSQVGR